MKWGLGLMALGLASCTAFQPGCLVENKGAQLISTVLVSQLQCSNAAQVEADILAEVEKLNLCPSGAKQGPVADSVCPAVSQIVAELGVSLLANKVVPATWGCSITNVQASLQAALQAACQQLPMKPKQL